MPTPRARVNASLALWGALAVLLGALGALALAAPPGTNTLVSRTTGFGPLTVPITNDSSTGGNAIGIGDGAALTVSDAGTGRFVAFVSSADGMAAGADLTNSQVYLRDRQENTTVLVSRADGPNGAGANAFSFQPAVSQDGRYVVFSSAATNLVPGATNGLSHIFMRDVVLGVTTVVDRADGQFGNVANGSSFDGTITLVAGQPWVAFSSGADNLDGAVPDFSRQVYVRNAAFDTEMFSLRDASSPPNANAPGNGLSGNPSLSATGTVVAFQSNSTNLVEGDDNGITDVFTRSAGGVTTIASSNILVIGNGESTDPSISADGNIVAFASNATNLVLVGDGDGAEDIYARNIASGAVRLLSRASGLGGAKADSFASEPVLTGDGAAVVFSTSASNLDPADTNGVFDVYIREDIFGASPTTTLVSRPSGTTIGDGPSFAPSVARAATGGVRPVVFTTLADNMGGDDENDFGQVYLRLVGDPADPPAVYLSRPTGTAAFRSGVNHSSLRPQVRSQDATASMSRDGRYTVFISASDEIVGDDLDAVTNVFRRDNLTGDTVLVSRADGATGPAANDGSASEGVLLGTTAPGGAPTISDDGNRIAFQSAATNLVAGDTNGLPDVFVRDVAAGTTVRVSLRDDDSQIPASSGDSAISGDGTKVAFVTGFAVDAIDANADADVYLRDIANGTTALVSRLGAAGPPGNDDSSAPALDADGSRVAFETRATDLAPGIFDLNVGTDVFLRDVTAGSTTLLSINAAGTATGDESSFATAIDADGDRVVFTSSAVDLGPADGNGGNFDVYLRDLAANATSLVSVDAGGLATNGSSGRPSISDDGTRVAFESLATDIATPDTNDWFDVFVRDLVAGTYTRVDAPGTTGVQLEDGAEAPSLSGDGNCIAFETRAQNAGGLPTGTDFTRVFARALRGDCPFGPVVATPPPPPGGPQPVPLPPPGPPPATNVRPNVTQLRIAPARFLTGARLRAASRGRLAVGARIRFTLSENARVTVRLDLLRPGRRLGARCVAPRRNLRRVCVRPLLKGQLLFTGRRRGANTITFLGRVNRRALSPGIYRATVRARDPQGLVSVARTVRFTILAPRR